MGKTVTIPLDLLKDMLLMDLPSLHRESFEAAIQAAENPKISIFDFAAKLERPLVFLDCETTGTNTAKDRIVSLSMIKLHSNGEVEEVSHLINPTIPIPAEATAIHKITGEDVASEYTFEEWSRDIFDFLEGSDLAHFNGDKFDVPLLCEEFHRCGIQWPGKDTVSVDVSNIFRKKESRSLEAAVQFYLQEEHANAHDAEADTNATMNVLLAQLKRYPDLMAMTLKELAQATAFDPNKVDIAGKFTRREDGYYYNFGKYAGKNVKEDPSYIDWMLGMDFTADTKRHARIIQESLYI